MAQSITIVRSRTLLRAGWLVLGVSLALAFAPGWGFAWLPILAVPWLLGASLLWSVPERIEKATPAVVSTVSCGVAPVVLGAHIVLATHLFSLAAALLLLTCVAALWLGVAVWKPPAARGSLIGLTVTVASATAALTLADVVIRVADLEHSGSDETVAYDPEWRENALGFRSRHEVIARDSGSVRVLALGDSFTWGVGVASTTEVWPARVEALLAERLATAHDARANPREPRIVEVINLGRPGFTTANEAELLRRVGWQFGPDLIVLQFFINDVLPSGSDFYHESGAFLFPQHPILPARFRTGAIRHTALYRFLQARYSGFRNRNVTWDPLFEEGNEGWAQFSSALQEIGETARARDVPVLFVLFPAMLKGNWTADDHPDAALHRRVARAADRAGLDVLDLTPSFARENVDWSSWWATRDDRHPNAAAHDLIARTISVHIAESWLREWTSPAAATDGYAAGP